MLYIMGFLFLIIAVSIDGFGVGMTYGMRQTKVPLIAIFIIMCCSGVTVFVAMMIGDFLNRIITTQHTEMLGGSILIGLGLFSLFQILRSKKEQQLKTSSTAAKGTLHDVKTVLTTPERADLDQSGNISSGEALLLGFALAMDAFGAGIGAAMLNYPPLITACLIAMMSGLFLIFGIYMGYILIKKQYFQQLSFLPAILLITIGLTNILL
ncbi:MAG TPA: sporulation membrane protein YtaF [Cerasibacillus sp.]|uniref:sporulation membrane protein YtaF n=1 Tax=Cerasibacillus sp. TaxID=2498711 RepID=UPI002F3EF093